MLAYQQSYRVLVLDMSDVPSLDYTAACAIKDMINNTLDADREVVLALPPGEPCALLNRERALEALSTRYQHTGRLSALRFADGLLSPKVDE